MFYLFALNECEHSWSFENGGCERIFQDLIPYITIYISLDWKKKKKMNLTIPLPHHSVSIMSSFTCFFLMLYIVAFIKINPVLILFVSKCRIHLTKSSLMFFLFIKILTKIKYLYASLFEYNYKWKMYADVYQKS